MMYRVLEHRRAECLKHKCQPPVSLGKGRSKERPSIVKQFLTLPEVCQIGLEIQASFLADLQEVNNY
jgi:hypothetical protein